MYSMSTFFSIKSFLAHRNLYMLILYFLDFFKNVIDTTKDIRANINIYANKPFTNRNTLLTIDITLSIIS